jgi:NADH-quinone oxidoreductase subunit A
MLFDYASVLVFLLFGVVFVWICITLAKILAPQRPNPVKSTPYECGEEPVGTPWIRFNPRYYLYALVFLIFDVEIAFMFPCAAIYRDWVERGLGKAALLEISGFVGILVAGLVYVWRKGDLAWVKTVSRN